MGEKQANVLNCSATQTKTLNNLEIPEVTTWLIADSNNINHVCEKSDFENILHMDLHSSKIEHICDDTFQNLAQNDKIKYLNMAYNGITKFSKNIVHIKSLEEVYVTGNPIECNCDTFWFVNWLTNFTTPSGVRIVKDYMNVTCSRGKWNGTRVHKLDAVKMGCFPKTLAT